MKRLIKSTLKGLWRLTQPLRRPVARKCEAFLTRCLRSNEQYPTEETNALMDHVVRELVRLQRQVDYLQQTLEDLSAARDGVAIAGEIEPSTRGQALKAG